MEALVLIVGFVLLLVVCGAMQVRYGTYRRRRQEKNIEDGHQPMLGDFQRTYR